MAGIAPLTTWEKAKEYIDIGTVESLGKLGRSEEQLISYRSFMDKVKRDYCSVADFIKISVLERACTLNAEGKKQAVDMEHSSQQRVWHKNDFPYNFEPDVQHWLLWSTEPLNAEAIWHQIDSRFPTTEWERLMFVNPAALQSILLIWHCHVLVRPSKQHQQQLANS